MYEVKTTRKFKKDAKRCKKRGFPMDELRKAIHLLKENGTLPANYHPHKLIGNYEGCWECHIKADWLLVWQQHDDELLLLFTDTGSHSDLFGK